MAKKAAPKKSKTLSAEEHRRLARDHDARADMHRAQSMKHRAQATLKSPPKKNDFGSGLY